MMLRSRQFLLITLLSLTGYLRLVAAGDGFSKINNYLFDNVDSDEIEPNLAAAERLLDEYMQKEEDTFSVRTLRNSLMLFVGLRKALDDNRCSELAYEVLTLNNQAVDGAAYNDPKPYRRVDKVIRAVALQHARDCQHVYPGKALELEAHLDQTLVARVRTFGAEAYERAKNKKEAIKERLTVMHQIRNKLKAALLSAVKHDKEYPKKILSILQSLVKNDPEGHAANVVEKNGKRTFEDEDKLRHLYNKYLYEPCMYFVINLGPEVFEPEDNDASLYKYIGEAEEKLGHDFLYDAYQYRTCRYLLLQDDKSNHFLLLKAIH